MLKAVESETYRIDRDTGNYTDDIVFILSNKETEEEIAFFKDELNELISLLLKAQEIL